jgi:hypothetical protein
MVEMVDSLTTSGKWEVEDLVVEKLEHKFKRGIRQSPNKPFLPAVGTRRGAGLPRPQ